MGQIVAVLPVKIITGLILSETKLIESVCTDLKKKGGPIDFISPILDFTQTDYYQPEMGRNLKRLFLSFATLKKPEQLVNLKLFANKLEKKYSQGGRRKVNIDPGYISLSKLVLATTKSFAHRIYIAHGIFEEITLSYKDKKFQAGPLTYPDYALSTHIEIFNKIRNCYYEQIKTTHGLSQLSRCV